MQPSLQSPTKSSPWPLLLEDWSLATRHFSLSLPVQTAGQIGQVEGFQLQLLRFLCIPVLQHPLWGHHLLQDLGLPVIGHLETENITILRDGDRKFRGGVSQG